MSHKRPHQRAEVHIAVPCASGTMRGSGIMTNLSLSGVLLEKTSIRPKLGAPVEIRFRLVNDENPLVLAGTLVRYTAAGFAIQFTTSPEIVRQMLLSET